MTHAQVNEERIIGWVDAFAQGFGITQGHVTSLLAGVRGAMARAAADGGSFDGVNVVRETDTVEFHLLGNGGRDCFVVHV